MQLSENPARRRGCWGLARFTGESTTDRISAINHLVIILHPGAIDWVTVGNEHNGDDHRALVPQDLPQPAGAPFDELRVHYRQAVPLRFAADQPGNLCCWVKERARRLFWQ